ncbi:MAG: NAD(P)/FAD-dependent oxidoreductase [Pseudonocardia sp.]|nr:NAD(P)/FAD-dependent oxidoreductase [Pseudonocardia sp.]
MLEKGDSLGGTWRDNVYPGCACDVESHLYSFSFFPNTEWTCTFARQAEIRSYLEDVADRYRLRDRIRFGATVAGAEWDGSGWDVRLADGETIRARYVVFGTGALHEPSVPEIEGLDRFAGTVFHSAQWDHRHDLTGRNVAVIGTGASAVQFVPAIAPRVRALTLFQRTAPWVLPKPDKPITERARRRFRRVPFARAAYRAALYRRHEALVAGFLHPPVMQAIQRLGQLYLRKVFAGDAELRRKVTPTFTMGCKRILMSNDYYPALRRDNVAVETGGISRITERGVVTDDGVEHEADTIVFGTGFAVGDGMSRMAITGRDGVKLSDAWSDGSQALLGTTIAGFGEPVHDRRPEHRAGPQLDGADGRVAGELRARRDAHGRRAPRRRDRHPAGLAGRVQRRHRAPAGQGGVEPGRLRQLVPRRARAQPHPVARLHVHVPPPRPPDRSVAS